MANSISLLLVLSSRLYTQAVLQNIKPIQTEVKQELPGDDLVPRADMVLNRAFTVGASPEEVWPWMTQIGPDRGGWPLPRSVERFVPPKKRGLQSIDPSLPELAVGSVIADWGGKEATAEIAVLDPPRTLVYVSERVLKRGKVSYSWAITLGPAKSATRVQMRLRLGPIKHKWLVGSVGGLIDELAIAGFAQGLNQRLAGY